MAKRLTIRLLTAVCLLLTAVATTHAQGGATTVAVAPDVLDLTAGSTAQIAITVTDVHALYGFDVALEFDPAVVEVVDADTTLDGTQIDFGTLLEPGFVIRNMADNNLGRVHFVMTQLNPSPPQSGGGTLVVLTLRAKQAGGTSPIAFVRAQLAGPQGTEIASTAVDGEIRVITSAPTGPTATPIPVQPPGTALPEVQAQPPTSTPTPNATVDTSTPVVASPTAVPTNPPTAQATHASNGRATATAHSTAAPTATPVQTDASTASADAAQQSPTLPPRDAKSSAQEQPASDPAPTAAPADMSTQADITQVPANATIAPTDAASAPAEAVAHVGTDALPPTAAAHTQPVDAATRPGPIALIGVALATAVALLALGILLGRRNQ